MNDERRRMVHRDAIEMRDLVVGFGFIRDEERTPWVICDPALLVVDEAANLVLPDDGVDVREPIYRSRHVKDVSHGAPFRQRRLIVVRSVQWSDAHTLRIPRTVRGNGSAAVGV